MKHNTYNMLYTHDGNKNVSEVMFANPINGIGAHYEYAPFGAITRTSKSTPISSVDFINLNPFRFSSEFHDQELGLVYYNYRHYNPTDGHWLTRDPIEEEGGWNLYEFLRNNALNEVDSLGEVAPLVWVVVAIIVRGVARWAIKKAAKGAAKKAAQELLKKTFKRRGRMFSYPHCI